MSDNIFTTKPTPEQVVITTEDEVLNSQQAVRTLDDAKVDDLDGDRKLKKKLACKTFAFMERFSIFSAIVLWIYISLHLSKGNPIPENVMIALITTTFVTVIGLVGFILKGLFGTK
ncbi:hypothetical protein DDN77_17710 [Vibrio cholerae]|nr:hypothetical protein [Vibrio cholerae]EGR4155397.1 hypothetical protein [Vibrio cholerae]EGR4418496.1 hypothetical protein [Vibrio cholerae]EJL6347029.1 hypothetical protein [Vibrio cholerae]